MHLQLFNWCFPTKPATATNSGVPNAAHSLGSDRRYFSFPEVSQVWGEARKPRPMTHGPERRVGWVVVGWWWGGGWGVCAHSRKCASVHTQRMSAEVMGEDSISKNLFGVSSRVLQSCDVCPLKNGYTHITLHLEHFGLSSSARPTARTWRRLQRRRGSKFQAFASNVESQPWPKWPGLVER